MENFGAGGIRKLGATSSGPGGERYHSPPAGDTSQTCANYASDMIGRDCQRTICRYICEGHFEIFSNSCAIVI
eukprot:s247_g24.t1